MYCIYFNSRITS